MVPPKPVGVCRVHAVTCCQIIGIRKRTGAVRVSPPAPTALTVRQPNPVMMHRPPRPTATGGEELRDSHG